MIDIDDAKLPTPDEVDGWTSEQFTDAHCATTKSNKTYNSSFRQLLHVGFKIAAKMGDKYLKALEANEEIVVAKNVTTNLWDRHIQSGLPRSSKCVSGQGAGEEARALSFAGLVK